jgi:hypothetical protein
MQGSYSNVAGQGLKKGEIKKFDDAVGEAISGPRPSSDRLARPAERVDHDALVTTAEVP